MGCDGMFLHHCGGIILILTVCEEEDATDASRELTSTAFPVDHTSAPCESQLGKVGSILWCPNLHVDTAQAPSHHHGSAGAMTSDLFSPIIRALFPLLGPHLIDWDLLKTN